MVLMASATSSHERSVRYFSSVGSKRWSIITTPSSVHSIVLIILEMLPGWFPKTGQYYLTTRGTAK
jgi:hypothetical protein